MNIGLNSLPPPHLVSVDDASAVLVTSEGQLPFGHRPDPQVQPRQFQLQWSNVVASTAHAILAHHDQHTHAVWQLKLRTGEVVRVQWSNPPTVQWQSGVIASSVSGEVEEALAFD